MKRFLLAILVFLSVGAAAPAPTATLPRGLKPLGDAAVVSVVDGDTVILNDRRQVRLVGTQAPKLPLGRKNFKAWPLGEESKAALEKLVTKKTVSLRSGGAAQDRHGRVLAHLVRDDGLWIQGEMLRQGWSRVYSFPDNRAAVAEMLALEQDARAAKRGIWRHPFYAIRSPDTVKDRVGEFEIVEGRVIDAALVKNRVYLNFGQDWRTDFTIKIEPQARRALEKRSINPTQFKGKSVRVRGWIKWENGPMIVVNHGEQLETLTP